MVKRRDYSEELVEAARSVLLEIVRLLGEYKNDIVVVGGWVPELLLPQAEERHIGSIDVDLALNHLKLSEAGYKTILELLLAQGYKQGEGQPFIFYRTVVVGKRKIEVEVDFLAGEYEGTGISRRTQRVQDIRPRKARGMDLVFEVPEKIGDRHVHSDVIGDAYEFWIKKFADATKKKAGEFYTPRSVVRLMIDNLNPMP